MDPWNLFTTADPTRSASLPWSAPSAIATELVGGVRTATAAVILSLAVATGTLVAEEPDISGEVDPIIHLDDDSLVDAIWNVGPERADIEHRARLTATNVLLAMRDVGISPDRAVADPDGGIALYAFGSETLPGGSHRRYARIAVSNEGDVVALCANRESDERQVWDATPDLRGALERVRAYLA